MNQYLIIWCCWVQKSANYKAREDGIKSDMRISEAKELCKNLEIIDDDKDGEKKASAVSL